MTMIPTFTQNAKTASAVPASSLLFMSLSADQPEQSRQIAVLEEKIAASWQRANAAHITDAEVDALIGGEGGWGDMTSYAATLRPSTLENVMGLARIAALVRSQIFADGLEPDDAPETITTALDHAVSVSLGALVLAA